MHTTNLRKVGGSVMLAVPPALLDVLELQPGAKVGIAVESGRLVVQPRKRPRYTLKELLTQCDPPTRGSKRSTKQSWTQGPGRRSKENREWLNSKPIGRELV